MNKHIKYAIGVVIIIAIGVGALFFFGRPNNKQDTSVVSELDNNTSTTTEIVSEESKIRIPPAEFANDRDQDGVDDATEDQYGTSQSESDTDGDGLNDWFEIVVWKTDPTKADTDGDGFADGVEIISGYNPRGVGTVEDLYAEDPELQGRLKEL